MNQPQMPKEREASALPPLEGGVGWSLRRDISLCPQAISHYSQTGEVYIHIPTTKTHRKSLLAGRPKREKEKGTRQLATADS